MKPSPSPPPPEITVTTINAPTPTITTNTNTLALATALQTTSSTIVNNTSLTAEPLCSGSDTHQTARDGEICFNSVLDDEIRSRLDKLNALSDLINSLERQFDEANSVFRDTLKCSTDRLSSIAKNLGKKSIRQGRVYNAAKLSVEQSQFDCRRACVQFEQANKDHQIAKNAIKEAELKLREMGGQKVINGLISTSAGSNVSSIDMGNLNLNDLDTNQVHASPEPSDNSSCDTKVESSLTIEESSTTNHTEYPCKSATLSAKIDPDAQEMASQNGHDEKLESPTTTAFNNAAVLSEELNQAIMRLIEAERIRGQSERHHMDRANKLMVAQENLIKLERDYGPSIRRSQLYFDEAKRFNAKLNSVKGDICRINEDIIAAKQAYAQTLSELEQFSDDLHVNSQAPIN